MKRTLNPLLPLALLLCGLAPLWLIAPAVAEPQKLPRIDKAEHKAFAACVSGRSAAGGS